MRKSAAPQSERLISQLVRHCVSAHQVKAARWRHGDSTICVVTVDMEGSEEGVIKAASLWNLPTSFLTYVYLLFESLWCLGLRGTVDYFRAILFTMDSDFSDLYDAMHKRLHGQTPIFHLDFIGE